MYAFTVSSSPRFGGCRASETDTIVKCAFSPNECNSPLHYVKAYEVQGGVCSHPAQVSIGRCYSSVDNNTCAISSDACVIRQLFHTNSDCSIVQDMNSNIGASTYYPRCSSNAQSRCVISKNDCEDGETFHSVGNLVWQEPCECDHVPTGICYLSSVSPITPDSSFCAVGDYDCPDSYSFLNATELLKLEKKPRTCNLCQQVDVIEAKTQHKHVVESGGCFFGDEFQKCALESKDCSSESTFKSSIEVRQMGQVPCPSDEMTTGRCTSSLEEIDCTGVADACFLPVKFEPNSSCTIHSDRETDEPSFFGMCRESEPAGGNWRNHRCVWQQSECIDTNEIYWHARQPKGDWLEACNCEHVQTGGCPYSNGMETLYYCAVSAHGCTDPSSYLASFQMNAIGQTCILCQPKRNKGPEPTFHPTSVGHGNIVNNNGQIPKAPTAKPNKPIKPSLTPRPTQIPSMNKNDVLGETNFQVEPKGFSGVEVFFLAFGMLAIIILIVLLTYRPFREKSTSDRKDEVRVPVDMNLDADGGKIPTMQPEVL